MKGYTNEQTIKDYLQIVNFTNARTSTVLPTWITAVEKYIEKFTGRVFIKDEVLTKVYDGNGKTELLIKDLLTLSKIEFLDEDANTDTTLDGDHDWYLYPENETPKTKIILNPENTGRVFVRGYQNIKLTGTFGYSVDVPEDIKLAATKLVVGFVQEFDKKTIGDIKSEALGDYSVTYTDIDKNANFLGIKSILDSYRSIPI